jgi:hypothetical protein
MKKLVNLLTTFLRKLNFVSHFLNSFPEPDLNVKGCFRNMEFIEDSAPHEPVMAAPPDVESLQTWIDPSMGNVSFI